MGSDNTSGRTAARLTNPRILALEQACKIIYTSCSEFFEAAITGTEPCNDNYCQRRPETRLHTYTLIFIPTLLQRQRSTATSY